MNRLMLQLYQINSAIQPRHTKISNHKHTIASLKPLIAFYGATGGCTLACVVECLKAGFDCTARPSPFLTNTKPIANPITLARTPSKLTQMLLSRGVSQSTMSTHLTISTGDVLKVEDVKGSLSLDGRPADIIISGIGIFTLRGVNALCTNAITNIISALHFLNPAKKLILIAICSTGITTTGPRDVPFLLMPLYHWLLKNPHEDKRRMEAAIVKEAQSTESAIGNFVIVRPTLLTNGKADDGSKLRVGTELGIRLVGMMWDCGCLRTLCRETIANSLGRRLLSRTKIMEGHTCAWEGYYGRIVSLALGCPAWMGFPYTSTRAVC